YLKDIKRSGSYYNRTFSYTGNDYTTAYSITIDDIELTFDIENRVSAISYSSKDSLSQNQFEKMMNEIYRSVGKYTSSEGDNDLMSYTWDNQRTELMLVVNHYPNNFCKARFTFRYKVNHWRSTQR